MKKIFAVLLAEIFSLPLFASDLDALIKQAEAGDAQAQYSLAAHYFYENKSENLSKAVVWAEKSAEQGNADGEALLSIFHYEGRGVHKDSPKAFELASKSAEKENAFGIYRLSIFYFYGSEFDEVKIVEKDRIKAMELLKKSAQMGNSDAMLKLAYIYFYDDERKAIESFTALANKEIKSIQDKSNVIKAQEKLAEMYLEGDGCKKNVEKAYELYARAAANGSSKSMLILAERYRKLGTDEALLKAVELYTKISTTEVKDYRRRMLSKEGTKANIFLACAYMSGKIVAQDYKKAFDLAHEIYPSAEKRTILSYLYYNGLGTEKNKKEALSLLKDLSKDGYAHADFILEEIKKPENENSYTLPNNDWFAEVEKMINSQK